MFETPCSGPTTSNENTETFNDKKEVQTYEYLKQLSKGNFKAFDNLFTRNS